jgi:hypothetical protein
MERLGNMEFTIGTALGIFIYQMWIKPKFTQSIINKITGVE